MKTNVKIKATTFSQCISLCLFNNRVILIMILMKLQYHQVLLYRRLCLRPSYECWPVRTIVRLKINKTTEPALHVKFISGRRKNEPKQNRYCGFFQNWNRTKVQKSIPHIPSCFILTCCCSAHRLHEESSSFMKCCSFYKKCHKAVGGTSTLVLSLPLLIIPQILGS